MTRQKPPTPPPPKTQITPSKSEPLPAFNPAALVLDLPAGGQTTNRSVSLKLPKDATADRIVEKIEVRQPDSKQGRVNLDREVENATLKPGAELTLPLSITATDSTGSGGATGSTDSSKDGNWSASLVAHIAGESRPVELAVYADRKPSWRPDPWRELAETVPSGQLVIEQRPLERSRAWLGWLVFGFVIALAGYAHWRAVRHSLTIKLDPVPIPPPDPPGRGFSFAKIGGPRRVVVEKKRSRRIADMLGHVAGLDLARTLDLTATIGRTCRSGGWPELAWERRKFTRRVLILEDARIETERKSSAIDDLLAGLRETGVEVEQLWFRRGIRKLVDSRGVEQRLRDLHAARNEYVVLVHTDGSGLTRESERQSLTALAEWPAVAIIDARGSEALASSSDPLAEVTLPKFAADEAGLTRAFRSFAGRLVRGASSTRDFELQSSSTRVLQSLSASDGDDSLSDPGRSTDGERKLGRRIADVERELELRLGDSLLWAADCVWLQPCSAALAEAVRSEFHEHLPSDRWRRWLDLPNSRIDADGLRFDTPVRTALRAIFKRRRDPDERRLVFECIERQLRESAPEEKNSLAYHVWEAALERFLLETRPSHSPRRLAELKPLVGPYLDESFHGFRLGDAADEVDHATPLELELSELASRQYLAAATDEFKGKLDVTAEPTARQRRLFATAGTLSSLSFVAALVSGLTTPTHYWRFESPAASEYELRELDSDGKSRTLGRWGREWT
ncbi:MAG TPA: hypothetical protein PLV92_14585, partial [Pirellulaceae bacterium]|nr:hypothetical protein [Pirellulaceae bacterium]